MIQVSKDSRRLIHVLADMFSKLPDGQSVTLSLGTGFPGETYQLCIEFQCATQDEVKALRACFPGAIWHKTWEPDVKWWTYRATIKDANGEPINLYIYACREAPPTCKAIVEKVVVMRQVPVAFEEREVIEERITWDCGGAAPEAVEA